MKQNKGGPKRLFFDLETLPEAKEIYRRIPSIGLWNGRTWKADIQSVICFGYKWEHESRPKIINAWDFGNWKKNRADDSKLLKEASKIILQADEVVTHNGKRFDWKVLQTRLAMHGLPSMPKIPHVDTLTVAKNRLSLYSNSLAEVAKFYKVSNKMHIQDKWDLWVRLAYKEESKKDLKLMADYCKMDVEVLEQIYNKLRPHLTGAVNYNLYSANRGVCPSCGSYNLHKNGTRATRSKLVQRLRCADCGTGISIAGTKYEPRLEKE